MPIVLVGKDYWQPLFDAIKEQMLSGERKTISPEERVLYNASARYIKGDRATLNAFFAPYNAMLAELVGNPDFTW